MKPLAQPADAEHLIVDYLLAGLTGRGQDITCGVTLPSTWARGTTPHVQVALDGTPDVTYPVLWRATIRVTCWASGTTIAKELAGLCLALLLTHGGDADVYSIEPLTGILPTRDPDTSADLASITVQVNLRGHVLS